MNPVDHAVWPFFSRPLVVKNACLVIGSYASAQREGNDRCAVISVTMGEEGR